MKKILLIIFAIIYVASPIDIIPDVIPIAGQADDLIAIIMAIMALKNKLD
ncbi:DUF1232 domain-containing protein [Sneathia sanguinegens]|jgi:hypothetical protein|uniref:DUF1232 domain-containing protein n=1 Tax=Sneathia sanguinegens TaxID=40543 RepID=A0ABT7HJQ9_9FUSO|nr:DUF1232 domain-containing protein [Sneathia sanguinegens]MDK9580210.1 DUF1232 domain-containing protein [Sneathia sanguinegens]MDU4652792.1 DUF1232 domain-containing protein [Sneathia sanguinegens]MDU7497127.1 DUF1232 domain-containing protein [Sneathia sanguinegens]